MLIWGDADVSDFSLLITNIFALLKPQFEDTVVYFFLQYVGHINKWNNCTSFK